MRLKLCIKRINSGVLLLNCTLNHSYSQLLRIKTCSSLTVWYKIKVGFMDYKMSENNELWSPNKLCGATLVCTTATKKNHKIFNTVLQFSDLSLFHLLSIKTFTKYSTRVAF
jgi:hypothetical protein